MWKFKLIMFKITTGCEWIIKIQEVVLYGMWTNNEDSRSYFVHCLSSHSRESNGSIFVYKRIVHGCFSMPFRFLFSLSHNREGRHDHSVKSAQISKYGVFSGPYFPVLGQEKAPYLDTFHAVNPNE